MKYFTNLKWYQYVAIVIATLFWAIFGVLTSLIFLKFILEAWIYVLGIVGGIVMLVVILWANSELDNILGGYMRKH